MILSTKSSLTSQQQNYAENIPPNHDVQEIMSVCETERGKQEVENKYAKY